MILFHKLLIRSSIVLFLPLSDLQIINTDVTECVLVDMEAFKETYYMVMS